MSVRILQVVSQLGHRAAEQQILGLAKGLPRDRFDLHVCALDCCLSQRRSVESYGVPVLILGQSSSRRDDYSWGMPTRVWKLIRHISRLSPDVVHIWSGAASQESLPTAVISLATRAVGAKVMSSQWRVGHASELLNRLGVQQVLPGVATNDLSLSQDALHTSVPLGVRALTTQSWSQKNVLLREAGLPPGAKLIVAYSDFSSMSRFKDAIWSADLLKVIRDDTHLIIIGDGPPALAR